MPFVSVIIPIYNVERYLRQCVDSVLEQKLDNIEIILVDDGSPDSCPSICDDYANKYDEIKVIHKKNGGLSSARNEGIRAAKGEYLIFMDSDDWWNPEIDVQEILLEVQQNQDVEMFLFTSYDYVEGQGMFKRNEHCNLKHLRTDSVKNYYEDLLNNGNLEVSACTKILKKEFIAHHKLYFKEGLLSEDNQWMLRLLRVLKSVYVIDKELYICRTTRQDSITHTIKKKNIEDLLTIIDESIMYYKNNMESDELKQLELCYVSYLWFSALGLCSKLNRAERKQVKSSFQKTKEVCRYSNSKKTKLCNLVMKVFGFNITMFVLGTYIKLKGKYHINRTMLTSN